MSIEVLNNRGEKIDWCGGSAPRGESVIETIEVGNYEFDRTEIAIGVLRFFGGSKSFMIGNVHVQIPDTIEGEVKFGHIEFPYEQFVGGVCWLMTQGGRYVQEFQVPLHCATDIFATSALQRELLKRVPKPRNSILELADQFEEGYRKPEGIYGMADTREFQIVARNFK